MSNTVELNTSSLRGAVGRIQESGGMLRTAEAMRAGVHPRTLYRLRDAGVIVPLSRGLYRLAELPAPVQPDLLAVALRVPRGVLCLISALAYHGLTTQIPHAVDIALPRGMGAPRLDWPPVHVYWFSGRAYTEGVEHAMIDGTRLAVYGPEKTLADCFKYRNKLGMDLCLEALRRYRDRRGWRMDKLREYAAACRVQHTLQPYVDALWSDA